MKLTLSRPIFNRIKRIVTDFCNSQEIDYDLMCVCGNNWFGAYDFNIVVPELLELINKTFKDSGINRTVSRDDHLALLLNVDFEKMAATITEQEVDFLVRCGVYIVKDKWYYKVLMDV